MVTIKQRTIKFVYAGRFSSQASTIEVLISKERGKPEVVTSVLTESQRRFLALKDCAVTWKSYAQASAKLRAYGWAKVEEVQDEKKT